MTREICVVTVDVNRLDGIYADIGDEDLLTRVLQTTLNPTDWESVTEEDYQILKMGEEESNILVIERLPLETILPQCVRDYRNLVLERQRLAAEKREKEEAAREARAAAARAKRLKAEAGKAEKERKIREAKEAEEKKLFESLKKKFGEK